MKSKDAWLGHCLETPNGSARRAASETSWRLVLPDIVQVNVLARTAKSTRQKRWPTGGELVNQFKYVSKSPPLPIWVAFFLASLQPPKWYPEKIKKKKKGPAAAPCGGCARAPPHPDAATGRCWCPAAPSTCKWKTGGAAKQAESQSALKPKASKPDRCQRLRAKNVEPCKGKKDKRGPNGWQRKKSGE